MILFWHLLLVLKSLFYLSLFICLICVPNSAKIRIYIFQTEIEEGERLRILDSNKGPMSIHANALPLSYPGQIGQKIFNIMK